MSTAFFRSFFTEVDTRKALFYVLCLAYVLCTSLIVLIEPFISIPCTSPAHETSELEFENVLFRYDPCDNFRSVKLLFFTRMECERGRHLLMAVLLGGLIGYERKQNDRPAGIRTMALVSLGSALFTVNSTFAFLAGPMAWDASRVSAAIPSGVGFLGAGLIVKSTDTDPITGERHHLVQGITTAAATWLSAAVGLACGGGLYFTASFSTALNLVLLRFGPRHVEPIEEDNDEGGFGGYESEARDLEASMSVEKKDYGGIKPEMQPLTPKDRQQSTKSGLSVRSRASMRDRPSLL